MASKRQIRNLLAVIILALAVMLAVTVVKNFERGLPQEEDAAPPAKVDIALEQVRYTETSDGNKRWTLIADRVEYDRNADISRLENVHITFFRPGEAGDVDFTANQGTFRVESKEVEAWGDVVVTTGDGMTFRTERARFNEKSRQIRSDEKVNLSGRGLAVTAIGMRYSLVSRQLELLSEVEADFELPASGEG